MRLPQDAGERIAASIAQAESFTSAELVLVGAPASGSYRDVDLWVAGGCALAFALLVGAPESHDADPLGLVLPAYAVGAALVGGALSATFTPIRRLLTRRGRRARQARHDALVAFHERGVDRTRRRTGLLVHVSFFERAITIVADRGLEEELTPAELELLRAPFEQALALGSGGAIVDGLCEALLGLGRALGERLPRDPDDVNELDDVPMMESST